MKRQLAFDVPVVSVANLHERLGFQHPLDYPAASLKKELYAWRMEDDDSPIFRFIYRNFRPHRHLEFGTWEGTGVVYVLEECAATVWTLNLLHGETLADGSWAYSSNVPAAESTKIPWLRRASNWMMRKTVARTATGASLYGYQTDSLGFIGRYYLERGLGHRVCQIYSDSREWDTSNYPEGFFDTCLIDGGHQEEVVANDTRKALSLVRRGGLIMWHDFCPVPDVLTRCAAPRGVVGFVKGQWEKLRSQTNDLFWVEPSHILIGIRS